MISSQTNTYRIILMYRHTTHWYISTHNIPNSFDYDSVRIVIDTNQCIEINKKRLRSHRWRKRKMQRKKKDLYYIFYTSVYKILSNNVSTYSILVYWLIRIDVKHWYWYLQDKPMEEGIKRSRQSLMDDHNQQKERHQSTRRISYLTRKLIRKPKGLH